MNGLDNYYRAQLAQHQAKLDAEEEAEPYTPTRQQKAFMAAYRLCIGNATQSQLEYYFENLEKAQEGTAAQQQSIIDGIDTWLQIEDAWLLWHEAIEYAKESIE